MNKLRATIFVAIVGLAAAPLGLRAQACLGNTAAAGHGYVAGSAGFTSGSWVATGVVGGNLDNPVAVQGYVDHTFVNQSDLAFTGFGGTVAVKVPMQSSKASVCPVGTLGYEWLSNKAGSTLGEHDLIAGAGLAAGIPLPTSSAVTVAPFGSVLGMLDRNTFDVTASTSSSHTTTFFNLDGGLAVGNAHVFASGDVSIVTLSGANPVFTFGLGVGI